MKEFTFSFKEALAKGLTPTAVTPRNTAVLIELEGMFPEDGTLRTYPVQDSIDTSSLGLAYPYPQIFICATCTIVCGPTKIWEYASGGFTLKISGLTAGLLWSVADFGRYVVLMNGSQTVTKDINGVYAVNTEIPLGSGICAVGGQAIVSAPIGAAIPVNPDKVSLTIRNTTLEAEGQITTNPTIDQPLTATGVILP